MELKWRKIVDRDENIIKSWLSQNDKKMLCMEQKSWQQTAKDIEDCLKFMPDSQFRNAIAYCGETPVCAMMVGVEYSGKVLRIFNPLVNPNCRCQGIGKQAIRQAIRDVFSHKNKFNLNRTFSKVVGAVYPKNETSIKLCRSAGLSDESKNDEYIDFSCDLTKTLGCK